MDAAKRAEVGKLLESFGATKKETPTKRVLSEAVVEELAEKKTALGGTLWHCLRGQLRAIERPYPSAPDAEAYTLFKPLFDPVIAEYHKGFPPTAKQPATDLGKDKVGEMPDLDPECKFIISIRVRCGRSLEGFACTPEMDEGKLKESREVVKGLLAGLEKTELRGQFHELEKLYEAKWEETRKDLIRHGQLFSDYLESWDRPHWPKGRGIFHNDKKTFLVWVNEEDHLRIISMQNGGNVGEVLGRLIKGLEAISAKAAFSRDERLGFLTFCPTNLGTTVRASALVRLHGLAYHREKFIEQCAELGLQIRSSAGEGEEWRWTEPVDLSNAARLGLTEYQAVRQMYDGVKKLIEMEKAAAPLPDDAQKELDPFA